MPTPFFFAVETPVTDFPTIPLWCWSVAGAGFYSAGYWLKASRQGRNQKALTLRVLVTFGASAMVGVPVAWFATEWTLANFPLAKTNHGTLPLVALVVGTVGHKIVVLAGEKLLGWAKAEGVQSLSGAHRPKESDQ